ncbi:hypothetical protein HX891_02085 [Pseudomonas reactans]|uniref:hypothetical protein n=1 Tax=Pseudomonas reactans TaxID=117680 RepID=UPI0015BAE282|nr:hypothetical protein [Pseudomonas reactans]NWD79149.1 hypothetical protein [Pseudomonas reactans]
MLSVNKQQTVTLDFPLPTPPDNPSPHTVVHKIETNVPLLARSLRRTREAPEPPTSSAKTSATAPSISSGALSWPLPLSIEMQREIADVIACNSAHLPGLPLNDNRKGALGYLLSDPSLSNIDLQNPVTALEQLAQTPRWAALGNAIQTQLKGIPTQTSLNDYVLAAISIGLDLESLDHTRRNTVAGFDLAGQAHWGQPPSSVVTALEHHLVAQGKATADSAKLGAQLLLARVAPEYRVKEVPASVVYGSTTWAKFTIAVNHLETDSPGSTASMSFAQVVAKAEGSSQTPSPSALKAALVDWAVVNGVVEKQAEDAYTPDQIETFRRAFNQQQSERVTASKALDSALPSRRDMALEALKARFGDQPFFEDKCLEAQRKPRTGRLYTGKYSMLDLVMAGIEKHETWVTKDTRIPLQAFNTGAKFTTSDSFKKTFDSVIGEHKKAHHTLLKHLIAQLPLEDRKNLEEGKLSFYRQNTYQIGMDIIPSTTLVNKGRTLTLKLERSVDNTTQVDLYEIDMTQGVIRKRNDARYLVTPSTKPVANKNYVIEEFKPDDDKQAHLRNERPSTQSTPLSFSSARTDYIANAVVEAIDLDSADVLNAARGITTVDQECASREAVHEFLLNLVPLRSAIVNFRDGHTAQGVYDLVVDVFGFLTAGLGVAGKLGKVVNATTSVGTKALQAAKILGTTAIGTINPLGGVGDLVVGAGKLIIKGAQSALRGTHSLLAQVGDLLKAYPKQPFATGIFTVAGQPVEGAAVLHKGRWHAFDTATQSVYGPPRDDFRASARTLQDSSFGGTDYNVLETALAERPLVIHRAGFSDVVIGDQVFRQDPKQPGVLYDLATTHPEKNADDLAAVCSPPKNGARVKRGLSNLCFAKNVTATGTNEFKRAQSLEHKRFQPYPNRSGATLLSHNRRYYRTETPMADQALRLETPGVLINYKPQVSGKVIDDPSFGLPNNEVDPVLNTHTRVVRLEAIDDQANTQRDVRAMVIELDHNNSGPKQYLVAEADSGVFYQAELGQGTDLDFHKIDALTDKSLGLELILKHNQNIEDALNAAKLNINNDLVTLPPLETIFTNLREKYHYRAKQMAALKEKVDKLPDEKKREFALGVWNKGDGRPVEVAAQEVKVTALSKPADFDQFLPVNKNRFYAQAAKKEVDKQLHATGVGSANQRVPTNPSDLTRQKVAREVVIWEYDKIGAPNYADIVLKTGAGNCDQMARAAAEIIKESGGDASVWAMSGHVFTVVGAPTGLNARTIDFSEPKWANAWIVDPWAEIECKASEYVTRLKQKMDEWQRAGKELLIVNPSPPGGAPQWSSPNEPFWLDMLVKEEKEWLYKA